MKKLSMFVAAIIAALAIVPLSSALAAATTTVVTPTNLDGWQIQTSGTGQTVTFEQGPATPPLGTGSAELSVGPDGDGAAQLRQTGYSGTRLDALTALSYSTYVTQNNGGQAAYILLNIDNDNNGTIDDQLFFEPVYQNGTYSGDTVPNQCPTSGPNCVELNKWQTWDALIGGWWSFNAFTFGPPLVTLDTYIAAHPDATIVNSSTGGGGVRIVAGFGAPAWTNFIGNVDAFTIGVGSNTVTYDFELFSAPSNKAQCKNDGWKTFNPPTGGPFKNQGDCIQRANTGK